MQKIVIDTNIVISAALTPNGNAARIVKSIYEGKVQAFYSPDIINEYKKVLSYERLNISHEKQKITIDAISNLFVQVTPATSCIHMLHEDDRVFYDTAKEAGAILITGNTKHFPAEQFIMSPTEYLDKYFTQEN